MSVERNLWREARKQINEYENRKAELQLDEQRELAIVELHRKEVAALKEEIDRVRNEINNVEAKSNEGRRKIVTLQKAIINGSSGTEGLNEQFRTAKSRVDKKRSELEDARQLYEKHLREQHEHLTRWSELYDRSKTSSGESVCAAGNRGSGGASTQAHV
ncbi:hypothetical protein BSKO_03324 [Bryopsis sp. KO-2023]|nr:hypothetical protein BSKO_03324 [Bryopsis sp. KO-2023]